MIRRLARKVFDYRDTKVLFRFEKMIERALRHTSSRKNLVEPNRVVALADDGLRA